ncbi:MAG TPA: hypothetical protein VK970_04385, partial [Candidatus Methylacidiphilales bacterium]|nr:hypothetical protein [Candidatus Methylacidiphilales bacterium]
MPEIRTDVPFISPVPANQVGLDTIMMMVNMDRANMLDGQVRAQAKAIQDKNTILTKSNLIYGEMKSAQSGGSNRMSPAMEQFLKDNGITVSGKTIVTLDGDTGITTTRVDMSKDQWDQQMGHMKTFID